MPTLRKLAGQDLLDKIIAVFTTASGRALTPGDRLSAIKFSFGELLKAVRKLDIGGAFIPEKDLRDTTKTLRELAVLSEEFTIADVPTPAQIWTRVRAALSRAGAMKADQIRSNTTLQKIGVGSDWIGYLDQEFQPEGIRFFDQDFKKAETARDVFSVVLALIDEKTQP